MFSGVLYAPIAPAYSLQAKDYGTLGRIFEHMQPGPGLRGGGRRFRAGAEPRDAERASSSSCPRSAPARRLRCAPLRSPSSKRRVQHRPWTTPTRASVRTRSPKILFTSGSTGRPKGVINTQRMLCANQEMIRSVLSFLTEEPVVLCDWLPWNHTAGGNHNFGLVLFNGGTLYIDEGRPIPSGIETTVRNLREIAATAHFTVPRTYEALMPYLRADAESARAFLQPPEDTVLRGRRPEPAVLRRAQRDGGEVVRRRHPVDDRVRRDRDGAVRPQHRSRGRVVGRSRPAGSGDGAQAGPGRRQDRGAGAWSEHHAGILSRRRVDPGGVRR